MSEGDWPDEGVNLIQSIADTKLVMAHRYTEWMLGSPTLEDDIAGSAAAQDEIGHIRQLFRLLGDQGRDDDWLEGERDPEEFTNASSLDEAPREWSAYVVVMDVTERAAWYLLDAVAHDDFTGLRERIGQDEYFHLDHLDARMETLAEEEPEAVTEALETALSGALAFLGPASDDDSDPLVASGFTDRSIAEIRAAYRDKYESLFEGTNVSLDGVDWDVPDADEWDSTRRRVGSGSVGQDDIDSLQGVRNAEYDID